MSVKDPGFLAAVEEAKQGFAEGGVPIGMCGRWPFHLDREGAVLSCTDSTGKF